jgi:hypothetical protein
LVYQTKTNFMYQISSGYETHLSPANGAIIAVIVVAAIVAFIIFKVRKFNKEISGR